MENEKQPTLRRSQSKPYNNNLFIISQIENKNILQNGWQSAFSGQKLSNKGFYGSLCKISAANDATANNVIYRNTSWENAKREVDKTYETFSEKGYINAVSDVEVVYFVEKEMVDPSGKVKNMNIINNDKNEALINRNYKKHLNKLISKNACRISFVKSKNLDKSGQLINDSTTSEILDTSIKKCIADNTDEIWKVSKIISQWVFVKRKFVFYGIVWRF